jgi:hypothetical protein
LAGDGDGVTCVRQRPRGELLQCAVHPARPTITTRAAPPPPTAWRGGSIDRAIAQAPFHGPPRAIAIAPGGWLAIVGWVTRLDQPSVVIWTAPPD